MSFTERLALALQGSINAGELRFALGAALVGGFLTAFTPCVYPLIPITIRYFGGGESHDRKRALLRAFAYVGGMILLYAVLGTVMAATKTVFGSLLASRYVTGGIALFCIAMAASMFGLFTLQLPVALSTRLGQIGGQSLGGAFAMGLASGVIAAPCTGPVLAVILTLIATTGSIVTGFSLMVAFGLGLGLPFLALALSSGQLTRLPRSGPWMDVVKGILAAAMLVVALHFLRVAWPEIGTFFDRVPEASFAALVCVVTGVSLGALYAHIREREYSGFTKAAAILLLAAGAGLAIYGGGDAPAPHLEESAQALPPDAVPRVQWEISVEAALNRARASGLPAVIDFTAEWCEACKQLDRETYADVAVRREATRFVMIKVDATELNEQIDALFARYGVLGLPTVVFIDSHGQVLAEPRVTGFVPASRFLELLRQVH